MHDREKLTELVHNARMNALWHNAQKPSEYITDMLISEGVTVRERGRWIQNGELDEDGNGQYHCSVCSAGETHNPIVDVPYCWKCGADMRGTEDA